MSILIYICIFVEQKYEITECETKIHCSVFLQLSKVKTKLRDFMEQHSPEDLLVSFVGVFVVGHNARLEILIQSSIP